MIRPLAQALFVIALATAAAKAQAVGAAGLPLQKGHTHAVHEVAWSPDDKLFLTYSAADGYLSVWEMPEARLRWRVEAADSVKDKTDEHYALRAFAWSDDGRFIALLQIREGGRARPSRRVRRAARDKVRRKTVTLKS